jgi:hypothetical protein
VVKPLAALSSKALSTGRNQRALAHVRFVHGLVQHVEARQGLLAGLGEPRGGRASGAKGFPFSRPSDLSMSIITRSRSSQGSAWITRSSDWKNRAS